MTDLATWLTGTVAKSGGWSSSTRASDTSLRQQAWAQSPMSSLLVKSTFAASRVTSRSVGIPSQGKCLTDVKHCINGGPEADGD